MKTRITTHQDIKPLQELANIPGMMRLDWFGGVSWNSFDETNPFLHFFLTSVRHKPDHLNPNRKIWVSDGNKQEHVRVGVGYLPYLSLGQIFHEGRHAAKHLWPKKNIIYFELDTSVPGAVNDHNLSDRVEEKRYRVSHASIRKHHWNAARNTRFKILRGYQLIPRPDKSGVERIPCEIVIHEIELIKYYYTNSHKLCKAVFRGDFSKDKLTKRIVCTRHTRYSFDEETGTGEFVYQHGFFRKDAPIIGRILFTPDNLAFRGVWRIAKSIAKSRFNSDGGSLGYPCTSFPFLGKTTLQLNGRWLDQRDGIPPFLAYQIHDCTSPFPFKHLKFQDAIDTRGKKSSDDSNRMFEGHGKNQIKLHTDCDQALLHGYSKSNEQPDAAAMGLNVQLSRRNYSGLRGVAQSLLPPRDCTHQSATNITEEEQPLTNLSTGDSTSGTSSSRKLSLSHRIEIHTAISRNIKIFLEVINLLRANRKTWNIQRFPIGIQAMVDEETYSCFPAVKSEYRPKIFLQFSYHDEEKSLRRRFICYQVEVDNRYGYLFEAESRERLCKTEEKESSKEDLSILFIRRPGFEHCDDDNFTEFLKQTVRGGSWPSQKKLEGFIRDHTIHGAGEKSPVDLANRVSRLIVRGLELSIKKLPIIQHQLPLNTNK